MIFRASPAPFALRRQDTPDTPRLRAALQADSLGAAAEAYEAQKEGATPLDPVGANEDAAAGRYDRETQSYLQEARAPGGSWPTADHLEVSGSRATLDGDGASAQATRWATTVSVEAAPGVEISATALPFVTVAGARGDIGEGRTLEGLAFAGREVKGIKVALADSGTCGAALGVALQASDKVRVLGPTRARADGTTLHLARFSTSLAPLFDADLALSANHVGGGLRVAVGAGRATTYEKYLPAADLARLMRARDHWFRNLIEFGYAARLAAGVRPTTLQALARDISRVDAWLPGERASWQRRQTLVMGVGAGTFGVRVVGTASVSGEATFTLAREDASHVVLSVEPGRQAGVRLSFEARLLGDASCDVGRAVRQRRAWRFHTGYMSSRLALARALDGEAPGVLLPASAVGGVRATLAYASLLASERLPMGVEAVEASFSVDQARCLSISGLRLPELAGGQSLFASLEHADSLSSMSSSSGSEHTRSSSRSSSSGLLTLGAASETSSISLVSEAGWDARGAPSVAAARVQATFEVQSTDSHTIGRRRLARRLSQAMGREISMRGAQKTQAYAVRLVCDLGLDDLDKIAGASDQAVADAARRCRLPASAAHQARKLIATFLAHGHGEGAVAEIRFVARYGYSGMRLLQRLAGKQTETAPVVDNAAHNRLLTDFLKAEIFAMGARDTLHAQRALTRTDALGTRLDAAAVEIAGDGALRLSGDDAVATQIRFVRALSDEVKRLKQDIMAGIAAAASG